MPQPLACADLTQAPSFGLKLFILSLGVLCLHLALMGWLQVDQHPDPSEVALTPVQTRQILALAPAQPQATPVAHQRREPILAKTAPEVTRNHVAAPVPPAAAPMSKLDATTQFPLPAATSSDNDLPAKSDISAGSANTPDVASVGKATPPTGAQLPSSNAGYLKNPPPPYPALSLRLHEAGKVVVRVLIGKNGQALDGHVVQSSGFGRLDQSALRAALAWRYVPGKSDGQARDMWFDIPISFALPN
jgi:protein TonB